MNSFMRNITFLSILILLGCTKYDFTWNVKKRPCVSSCYYSDQDFFSQISMAEMTNNTSGTGPNNFYEDKSIKVKKGQTYSLDVNFETTKNAVAVYAYFDWNGDADFEDSGESVFISDDINIAGLTQLIPVPYNAVKGNSFARFIIRAGSDLENTPCLENSFYGEIEDYPLVIE